MSSTANINRKIRETHEFLDRLDPGRNARILVAFSGGPDSTALLNIMQESARSGQRNFAAAYYNHALRGAEISRSEIIHAETAAKAAGMVLHIGGGSSTEIAEFSRNNHLSIEESARIMRYDYFNALMTEHDYYYLATGHTADDQIETMIQRFAQGSGIWGLSGISRAAGNIIRPIMGWSKGEVLEYVACRKLKYIVDASNASDLYLRNKIRKELVPTLENIFPGFRSSMERLEEKMKLQQDFVAAGMKEHSEWHYMPESRSYSISLPYFESLHPVERIEWIRKLSADITEPQPGTGRLPFGFFQPISSAGQVRRNGIIMQGHCLILEARGGLVILRPDVVLKEEKRYFIVVNGREPAGWEKSCQAGGFRINRVSACKDKAACLPADALRFPMIIRSRRGGDLIHGKRFAKDLKKLYNDWKVPDDIKGQIPVCADRGGIAAVMGSVFGYSDYLRKDIVFGNENKAFIFTKSRE
jgi:tRNA(Ile)-lysidine synthetase-like protein